MSNEFTVNTYSENWQDEPVVEAFADGSFVIMWRSFFFDTDTYYIAAQRYDASGAPIGGEFVVDGIAGSASEVANLTRLKDGGFVVTFAFSPDGLLDQDQVYAKIYNSDFSVRRDSYRVDTVPDFQSINTNAAALDNGGFIVFFDSDEARRTQDDIYAQRYDRNGNKIGGNFLVNTRVKDFDQNGVEIAQLKGGNVLAIWHSEASYETEGDLDSNEIRGTLYSKTGAVLKADFSITDAEGTVGDGIDLFNVAELSNGGFALVRYETENPSRNDFTYDVKLKLFNVNGVATSREITVHASTRGIIYDMDVAQLATGEIVVIWQKPSTIDFPYDDVFGRIYDASGRALTGAFQIAQDITDGQEEPEIKALAGGGFVVTYMSEAADPDHDGIAARVFGRASNGDDVARVDATGSIAGLGGNDSLFGNAGRNTLNGGTGNDWLAGQLGRDTLVGGTGADKFIFSTALNASSDVDQIRDFTHGWDDIVLSKAVFAKLGFAVEASELRLGTVAKDANDFLVYNKATGDLFFDFNGSAKGGHTMFADFKPGTVLTFDDFLIL